MNRIVPTLTTVHMYQYTTSAKQGPVGHQGRRKQIKSGEAISSVRSTHVLGGSGGMPPMKILLFEVVSEQISAKCKR